MNAQFFVHLAINFALLLAFSVSSPLRKLKFEDFRGKGITAYSFSLFPVLRQI